MQLSKSASKVFPVLAAASLLTCIAQPTRAYEIKSATPEVKAIVDDFQSFANTERQQLNDPEALRVDLSRLVMQAEHNVRILFINEGAGYRNQLGFTATKNGSSQSGMIFNDVSAKDGILSNSNGPLMVGDYVDLGIFEAGTQLDFWLISDGFSRGCIDLTCTKAPIFGTNAASNPDGLEHVAAYYKNDYVILGFEDINGGGDLDYNDTVFAIDFGRENARAVADVPEPTTSAFLLMGMAGTVIALRKRKLEAE